METLYQTFPRSRMATFDVYETGKLKHHIPVMLECDVTESRIKLKAVRSGGPKMSFNAWMLHVIGKTIGNHPEAAGYLYSRKKILMFRPVNISIVVEKEVEGRRVPIPLVIEGADSKSVAEITAEIGEARAARLTAGDIVLNRRRNSLEGLYYHLPGSLRRAFWRMMIHRPRMSYPKMGNVMVTHPGMMGQIPGWFIHRSVHPLSFGIGSVLKKPWVVDHEIRVRDILHLTILLDHDVIDGAPMARFIQELIRGIEQGEGLD